MSIEGQGHFFTIYFPGLYVLCFTNVKISGERLQDQWSSGFSISYSNVMDMEIIVKDFSGIT